MTVEDMAANKMPFTIHLAELRKRVLIFLGALIIAFSACFYYSESIFRLITLPLRSDILFMTSHPFVQIVPKEVPLTSLVFLAPAEAFWVHLKVALIAGLVFSMPVLLRQLWLFVSPGLLEHEKKYALPFLFSSSVLFFTGTFFCFFIVLPFAMRFLLTYKTASLTPMISVERYVDFCLKFILAFGAIFELPIVLVFLTRMGLVSPKTLARNRKYAVLMAFVAAAFLTPTPDAFNQTLMAVPIIVLYEAGIIASRIFLRGEKDDGNDDKGEEP